MLRTTKLIAAVALASAAAGASCGTTSTAPSYASRAAMLDPATCKSCHADHYRDWSGSMHAYAAQDPVFVAMNARGQRETRGALGSFCVNCHAPMAVREGATRDGLNLETVPAALKGVTCFFCHAVDAVEGTHDAALHLASDTTMRGPFGDPLANAAHPSRYSELFDRNRADSSKMCGACHDIVNGHGVALERTLQEWEASVYSAPGGATCGQCHMDQSADLRPVAQVDGAPLRRYHLHQNPGVDIALTPFPEATAQKSKVQAFLNATLQSALCVGDGNAGIGVLLDNVAAGHSWPSGAAQDRRAWTEVVAYAGAQIIYQSGVPGPDGDVTLADADVWFLRDCMFDAAGAHVPMFWQATRNESYLLPGQPTFDPKDPRFYQTHVLQRFPRAASLPQAPDRVTLRVRVQPVGVDVLRDLVASGDLASDAASAMPIFDVGEPLEWTAATGKFGYAEGPVKFTCVTKTALNFTAQSTPAPAHADCKP